MAARSCYYLLIFVFSLGCVWLETASFELDHHLREKVEHFLKGFRKLSSKPSLATSNDLFQKLSPKKKTLEMIEDTLRLINEELYGGIINGSIRDPKALLRISQRQSFFTNGLASLSEYMMSLVENSMEDLPSLPRLEAQECMKRSVCEAHSQPKKYGLMGLVLQLLFPPYTKNEDPNNVVSKYQLAARYGRQNNANCGIQYDGCMLNLLDIIQAMVNAFIR